MIRKESEDTLNTFNFFMFSVFCLNIQIPNITVHPDVTYSEMGHRCQPDLLRFGKLNNLQLTEKLHLGSVKNLSYVVSP
jgi:hypothetical protein